MSMFVSRGECCSQDSNSLFQNIVHTDNKFFDLVLNLAKLLTLKPYPLRRGQPTNDF